MQTVKDFIDSIIGSFDNRINIPYEYLLAEYNAMVRELSVMIPTPDRCATLTSLSGKIESTLLPSQIRRVFFGDNELLKASKALMDILPEAMLYRAEADVIYVNSDGEYRVYYKALPPEVGSEDNTSLVCEDSLLMMLVRAYLLRAIYLFVGDTVSAECYTNEYNSLLEDYKKQNGVRE